MPNRKTAPFQEWCPGWLNELKKNREVDKNVRKQIEADTVHTCEKHFHPDDIETCKLSASYSTFFSKPMLYRPMSINKLSVAVSTTINGTKLIVKLLID